MQAAPGDTLDPDVEKSQYGRIIIRPYRFHLLVKFVDHDERLK